MGLLEGKVAAITGATSGIGARTAELFVEEGANVVIAGRRATDGEALAQALGAAASFIRTDVANEADVAAMIARAVAKFGRLDCLFNNAGNPGPLVGIAEVESGQLDALIAVHVRGVMLGMKHAAPVMRSQGSGSIINTASVAGQRAGTGSHLYGAAKAAVLQLTRSVAMELGEQGIRVNSISPGGITTGIFAKGAGVPDAAADRSAAALKASFSTLQPIPRAGLPDDVAHAALFLASDGASFVNGHDLVVDGGLIGGMAWSVMLAKRREIATELQAAASRAPH